MSKKRVDFDVLIVGAGVAGSVFAFHVANAGFKVLVLEKKDRDNLGVDWSDSIEKQAFYNSAIDPPRGDEKKHERNHLAIISPDLKEIIHLGYYNYWIVDRKLFQKRLVNQAEKAGAKFIFGTEVVEPIGKGMWVIGVKTKNEKVYRARLIIDASGRERILGRNIEVLDLNYPLKDGDLAKAYREVHKVTKEAKLAWGDHEIKKDVLYYRYGYQGGYSWLNYEDEETLDVGAGVRIGKDVRKPKKIVNEYVNSHKDISSKVLHYGGGTVVVRRPITMVWYGLMIIGDAACQAIPVNGCGVGSAMVAAKIAAEVAIDALRTKEVSINKLWAYQVKFMELRGRDHAALDMMRRTLQNFSENEISVMIKNKIIGKKDFEDIIHGKFPKIGFLRALTIFLHNLGKLKLLLKLHNAQKKANEVYKHYKQMPKEYDTRKYHQWLLKQLYLFKQVEKEEKTKSLKNS